jgi:hypothetical protein
MRRHCDEVVELVVRLIVIVRIDQAQVDRSMAAIGDDREQDVVAGLGRPSRCSIALMRASSSAGSA